MERGNGLSILIKVHFGYKLNTHSCMTNFLLRRSQRLSPHHPDHQLFRCARFSRPASAIPIHHFVALAFDLRRGAISRSDEVEASVHTTSASRPPNSFLFALQPPASAIPMSHFANIRPAPTAVISKITAAGAISRSDLKVQASVHTTSASRSRTLSVAHASAALHLLSACAIQWHEHLTGNNISKITVIDLANNLAA